MTLPKLYYFDIAGKGEALRLLFFYSGIEFEDIRCDREKFDALKSSGFLPFGQLPVLELSDGRIIAQSAAIARYIGKLSTANIYPSDLVAAAIVDSLIDQEADLFAGLSASRYRGETANNFFVCTLKNVHFLFSFAERMGFGCLDDATVAKVRESLNNSVLPRLLGTFESFLSVSKSGWLANTDGPTIADFILVP